MFECSTNCLIFRELCNLWRSARVVLRRLNLSAYSQKLEEGNGAADKVEGSSQSSGSVYGTACSGALIFMES